MTTVGVLRETAEGERRVALTPDGAQRLRKQGVAVAVEAGAGRRAFFGDEAYVAAGATTGTREQVYAESDVLVCIEAPEDVGALRDGHVLVGLLAPLVRPGLAQRLAVAGVTAVSLDLLPRTLSRAQAMDALTSQANVAGYKAAIVAAEAYGGFFPMLMTAAGTTRPAQVLVLGAGVAGLQAIATARRLGALVTGYDVREQAQADIASTGAAVLEIGQAARPGKDGPGKSGPSQSGPGKSGPGKSGPSQSGPSQSGPSQSGPSQSGPSQSAPSQSAPSQSAPSESGYARGLTAGESAAQQTALEAAIPRFDVVITTAQVPGRRPPVLVTAAALATLRPGSVVVDLAAGPLGGNVDGSVPDKTVVTSEGVTVLGAGRLPSSMPLAASTAYARNVLALLAVLMPGGAVAPPDLGDEIQAGVLVTHGGVLVHPQVRAALEALDAGKEMRS